jgi:hypothetical protein
MGSTLGGNDPFHDLSAEEKDRLEAELREQGAVLRRAGKAKEGRRKYDRAVEISRIKSKRAHQRRD